MNNLVVVILSIAFLACNIPSAFSADGGCSHRQCLRNSGNTQCCIRDAESKTTSCQTLTAALINTTFEAAQKLTSSISLNVANALKPTVDSLNLGVPLSLNTKLCGAYSVVQNVVAVGGVPHPAISLGK